MASHCVQVGVHHLWNDDCDYHWLQIDGYDDEYEDWDDDNETADDMLED